jgi:galactitol-specific phosphotransferase system IIB component
MLEKAGAPDMRECDCDINTLDTKGAPLKLTNEEILQAFTDAIGGLAVALGRQIDPKKLAADLRTLADEAERVGTGPSAGLLDEIARTVEVRCVKQ